MNYKFTSNPRDSRICSNCGLVRTEHFGPEERCDMPSVRQAIDVFIASAADAIMCLGCMAPKSSHYPSPLSGRLYCHPPIAESTPETAPLVLGRLVALPGYEPLAAIFDDALLAAQAGKGVERHANPGQAFTDQPIVWLCEAMGSIQGDVFQACKNALEACRLPDEHARRLLMSAIVYLGAAAIQIDRRKAGRS